MRKSKRKSLRSKRKSRKHGGNKEPSSITRGWIYGHKPCGTKRGNIDDIICQSKKVKAYSESKEEEYQLDEHKKKLADSIKTYIKKKYKKILITSDEIKPIIPQIQAIDNLDKTNINTIISTIPSVDDYLKEFNDQGHY